MIESIFENFPNLTPPVTSQTPGTQKGSKVNNLSTKLTKKLKFGICTNFDMGNTMMESKCEKFQNLTPPVTPQAPGTQKVSKVNNYQRKWYKKLKFGISTNFYMGNTMMESKCEKFQNLTPPVTSQAPGTQKGSKVNNFSTN